MPIVLKIYWVLWNQSIVFALIVTSFYWILIYAGQPVGVYDVIIHITNSAVLCFDLLVVKHPPKYSNLIFLSIMNFFYFLFTVFFQFLGGHNK